MSKMKPRSGLVTDGLERAPARGMLRAVGMGDEDWVKPQIGIASSWNEITPCNLSLDRLAKASRKGVIDAGGFPMQFGTISVSDGISMGHEGMHFSLVSREVIADSVETVMQAERLDGMVTFAGCDKSLPGMMMAAARIDVASVFVYAGSTLPGQVDGKDVTIIDAFEAVGACARGLITQDRVDQIEKAICPGEGACGGMYTANTMATVGEAIGLSLPGSAAPPAVDRRRWRARHPEARRWHRVGLARPPAGSHRRRPRAGHQGRRGIQPARQVGDGGRHRPAHPHRRRQGEPGANADGRGPP